MNNNLEAADIEETPYAELNQVSATFDQMKRQIRTMITELHETHQMKDGWLRRRSGSCRCR